jgi:hypothetical protein
MSAKQRFCAVCNAEIAPERIETVPETRLCTAHGEAIRKYGGEFISTGRHTSLGKPGSLKQITGDVSVERKRNDEGLARLIEDHEREQWQRKSETTS